MSNPAVPSPSSPESGEENQGPDPTAEAAGPPDGPDDGASAADLQISPLSVQKRRRVTRACDECRRKKIKCDGKQPCTHCTVYSYECTYDQPSNRRRNPAPQQCIDDLQNRLRRAEAIIKAHLPEVDLDTYELDLERRDPTPASEPVRPLTTGRVHSDPKTAEKRPTLNDQESEALLESMVDATAQLDLDDRGYWDYHGHSSGVTFLRRMRNEYGDLFGSEAVVTPFIAAPSVPQVYASPLSSTDPSLEVNPFNVTELPPKAVAMGLASNALDDACTLMRFVHRPTFYALLNRVYDSAPDRYDDEVNRFRPLLYVVLALGCLFAKTEQSELDKEGYASATAQGFKYFSACRQMIDITDCRDITSLQALLFMILFLQSSARLTTCYSYIGIALRAAVRMGLHRSVATDFNPIEREIRKRVFWVVRKMDVYVGALLGLPKSLSEREIDQEYPLEVDDEYITEQGILPMPEGTTSLMAGVNAHTKLVRILGKVIKYIYPIKRSAAGREPESYRVSYARVKEVELDLQGWMDALPPPLRMGEEGPPEVARVQQLLRIAYAHIQMMLYRPFLHYVSQGLQPETLDRRSYACAAACVSVCRNLVHITIEMNKRRLLLGAYWFTMYATFFAILSLVFYVLEHPSDPGTVDILKDAKEGKDALASLAKRSMAADRCSATLTTLFNQLPERLKRNRRASLATKKKRQAPSSNHEAPSDRRSAVESAATAKDLFGSAQRPNTFSALARTMSSDGSTPSFGEFSGNLSADRESPYRNPPPETTTPTDPSTAQTPESPTTVIPLSREPPAHMAVQQQPNHNSLPQLNSIMFPSTDPFAYPNNPMTFLEDQPLKRELSDHTLDNAMFMPPDRASNEPYGNTNVQMFGALPSYLMQGQPPGPAVATPSWAANHPRFNPSGNSHGSQELFVPPITTGAMAQGGFSLDEMFGYDEWSGNNLMMNQHYHQQQHPR